MSGEGAHPDRRGRTGRPAQHVPPGRTGSSGQDGAESAGARPPESGRPANREPAPPARGASGPSVSENEQIARRREKLGELRSAGNPYPNDFRPNAVTADVHERCGGLEDEAALSSHRFRLAGRMMTRRVMGKASFAHLRDRAGRLQLYVRRDDLPDGAYRDFRRWDIGDLIGAEGVAFRTRTGELSLRVESLRLLAKALRPLPEKFHGLADRETRYRRRHLDLIMNEEARETFRIRSRVVDFIRRFFAARGFLEVETPMMQPLAGGAAARPFETRHHALGIPLYLRIAPELYLKRLVVGGFERVFEINRNFRNEGLSTRHNPEFTMLEFYQAYADYRDLMDLTEELLRSLARDVSRAREVGNGSRTAPSFRSVASGEAPGRDGGEIRRRPGQPSGPGPSDEPAGPGSGDGPAEPEAMVVEWQGQRVDFGPPFERLSVRDAVLRHVAGMAAADLGDPEKVLAAARGLGIELGAESGAGKALVEIFEREVEPRLTAPTFVTHYPIEVSPLARRNDGDPSVADRFELFIGGREIANGFSELNDPDDQADRFRAQARLRSGGDEEAMAFDEDYVEALEYGLPPTAGEGIGIDRLVMLFTDSASIRDVILFPHMRPQRRAEPRGEVK